MTHADRSQRSCQQRSACTTDDASSASPKTGTTREDVLRTADAPTTGIAALGKRLRAVAVTPLNFLHAKAPRLADLLPWLVSLWFGGVFFLTTRLAIGWQEARWLRQRGVRPVQHSMQERFEELLAQLRISRPVRLLESTLAEVPTVVGWLRPVVLLPTAAITGLPPRHLEALIAHELTHVKRHDYLVNLLQTMVETLLFYHPAVWWVSNRIRDERENCCDDVAVDVCGDAVLYARALTNMEGLRGTPVRPELAMAADGGSLVSRVRRLVGRGGEPTTPGAGVVVGALLVALSTLLAVSAVRTTDSIALEATPGWQNVPGPMDTSLETGTLDGKIAGIQEAQPAPQLPRPGAVSVHPETPKPPVSPWVAAAPEPKPEPAPRVRARPNPRPRPQANPNPNPNPNPRANPRPQAEPRPVAPVPPRAQPDFELQDIVQLKKFGIDVDYYDEMTDIFGPLEVDELVALKMYDVDEDYIEEMQPLFEDLQYDDIVALKMYDVDRDYVEDLSEVFGEELEMDEVVHLRQQGVQSHDLRDMMESGLDIDPEEAVAMHLMGVRPDVLDEYSDLGLRDASLEDLVRMAKAGIDVHDVEELQHVLGPLTVRESIALLTNGVDADEVEELQDMGMRNPHPELLVRMYSLGLTADVIDTILDDEMEDVPVDVLLYFKDLGLEDIFIDEFRRRNE